MSKSTAVETDPASAPISEIAPGHTPARKRLDSLDAFRGLTIAGMILVNNPGSWSHIYPPLEHAEWHGCTPTDLIFPFFVFIMGVSIELSLSRRIARGDSRRELLIKVVTRGLVIFAIGLFLSGFPRFNLEKIRIPGVLQRLALCYTFAAAFRIFLPIKGLIPVALALLFGYWGLMEYVPAPGGVAGDLSRSGNLAAWLDRLVFGVHKYKPDYDPEGLLSTIPAIGSAVLGIFAGAWLRTERSGRSKVLGLLTAGLVLTVAGWFWDRVFPINKALWTSSFVAFTAGLALFLVGLMYLVIDVLGWRKWSAPLRVFGLNPILAFAGGAMMTRVIALLYVHVGEEYVSLKPAIYQQLLGLVHEPMLASLLFAAGYVLLWFILMLPLFRQGIAVRV